MTALDAAVKGKDKEWIRTLMTYEEYQTTAMGYVKELLNQAIKML
jgi:hypothetical protein